MMFKIARFQFQVKIRVSLILPFDQGTLHLVMNAKHLEEGLELSVPISRSPIHNSFLQHITQKIHGVQLLVKTSHWLIGP